MISEEQVKHIAKLARIGVSKEETNKIQEELSSILDYFNMLSEVDTKNLSLSQKKEKVLDAVARADETKKESPETITKIIKESPQKEKGYIKVKTVF